MMEDYRVSLQRNLVLYCVHLLTTTKVYSRSQIFIYTTMSQVYKAPGISGSSKHVA